MIYKPNGLNIPAQNALELRKYIVEHIKQHPQFNYWLRTIWGSQVRKFNDFVKLHLKAGVYTDNYGIVLYTTQHLLKITIHLVSSNNNDKNPFTVFDGPEGSDLNPIFWVGYHQDTTDLQGIAPQETIKAGPYESLKKIDEQERNEDVVDKEIVSKLKTEESILKLLGSNQSVVDSTVERLNNLKVKPNDLLDTDTCYTLYSILCVHPNFASDTSTGIKIRKLIKKFENICKLASGYNAEPLNITLDEPVQSTRTFRDVFRNAQRDQAQRDQDQTDQAQTDQAQTDQAQTDQAQTEPSPSIDSLPSQEKRPDVQAKEPNPENRLQRGRISSGTIVSFQNVPFESTRIPSTSEQEIVSVAVTHQGAKPKKNKKNPKRPPISQIFDVRLASLSPAQNIPEPTQNTLILPESPVNILDSITQIPSLSVTYESPLFSIVDKPAKRGRKKRVMNITDSSVDDSRKIKRRRLAEMAAENLV